MSLVDQSLLREVISLKHKTGVGPSGDAVYGALVTGVPARIERASQSQLQTTGDLLNDTTVMYTVAEILKSDIIWFPEDDTASVEAAHRPVIVSADRDLDGVIDHYEVTF